MIKIVRKKKQDDPFKDLQGAATGIAGLGVTTGVTAGVVSRAPSGLGGGLTQGLNTLSGFTGVATTTVAGKSVLKSVKGFKKNVF